MTDLTNDEIKLAVETFLDAEGGFGASLGSAINRVLAARAPKLDQDRLAVARRRQSRAVVEDAAVTAVGGIPCLVSRPLGLRVAGVVGGQIAMSVHRDGKHGCAVQTAKYRPCGMD